jgi:hypothetical protein
VHGWAAWFPVDRPPVWDRFGPSPVEPGELGWPLAGEAGSLAWALTVDEATGRPGPPGPPGPPLWTFPRAVWERQLLPAAQVVAAPSARVTGQVCGSPFDGTGGLARIYGHGNAQRWAWLHADLGDGDVCEVVTAVARRPGLDRLPAAAFVRVRLAGRDLPLALARTRLGLPSWSVRGRVGRRRLRIDVTIPPDRAVAVGYVDPDGGEATCTNSERADARVVVGDRTWDLVATAHAEVGTRE